jgi:hypothetical protein
MKLCIGLCVYNNAQNLPDIFNNVKQLQTLFSDTKTLIFYDECADNSLEIILQEQEKKELDIILLHNPDYKRMNGSRMQCISYARNQIMKRIREKYPETDYMAMYDCNKATRGNIRLNVIQSMLDRKDEWDGISFNRELGYYDYWALSIDPFIYSFLHFENNASVVKQMREYFSAILEDYKTNRPNELIEVYSAFNGFAIYKWEIFQKSYYSSDINLILFPEGTLQKQEEVCKVSYFKHYFRHDCEHRRFHLQAIMNENARIRVSAECAFDAFIDDDSSDNPYPNSERS